MKSTDQDGYCRLTSLKSNPDIIKTFLQIKTTQISPKPYYKIDDKHQIFSILNFPNSMASQRNSIFENNKIFTDECNNSDIYEEICKDCIRDSLLGKHFTFFSYGISSSDKYDMILGKRDSYNDINQRGFFLLLIENYLKEINNNDNYMSLSISYTCLNNSNAIDLSDFIGKDNSKIQSSDVLSKAIDIKPGFDITSSIKRIPTNNTKNTYLSLMKLFQTFEGLNKDKEHLLTRSHFVFIIYITNIDDNILSTISFVILSGSEQVVTHITNPSSSNTELNKINTKYSIENNSTFSSVLYSIKQMSKPFSEDDTLNRTKLSLLLTKVCFNHAFDMNFRIIGCIVPSTSYDLDVKDTLMFLFDCKRNVIKKQLSLKVSSNLSKDANKDELIYDLKTLNVSQMKEIKTLTDKLVVKEDKINNIKDNYKAQVNALRKIFNFKGDINILLSGDQNTKEAKCVHNIRETSDNLRIQLLRNTELEDVIKALKEENHKLKTLHEVKETDLTLLKLYIDNKKEVRKDLVKTNEHNDLYIQIEELQKQNRTLMEVNAELNHEIIKKGNIIRNLPKAIKPNNELQPEEEEEVNCKKKEDAITKLKRRHKKEISEIGKANQREFKEQQSRYENLLSQKDNALKNYIKENDLFGSKYNSNINKYKEELFNMNELTNMLITEFRQFFNRRYYNENTDTQILQRAKEDYNLIATSVEKSINYLTFPLLYEYKANKRPDNSNTLVKYIKEEHLKITKDLQFRKSMSPRNPLSPSLKISLKQSENALFKEVEKETEDPYFMNESVNLKSKIQKLNKTIEELVTINNKNKIMLNSNERAIDKLMTENFLLKNSLRAKSIKDRISFPLFSTNNDTSETKTKITNIINPVPSSLSNKRSSNIETSTSLSNIYNSNKSKNKTKQHITDIHLNSPVTINHSKTIFSKKHVTEVHSPK